MMARAFYTIILVLALGCACKAYADPVVVIEPVLPGVPLAGAQVTLHDDAASTMGVFVDDNASNAQCTGYAQVQVSDLACQSQFYPVIPTTVEVWTTSDRETWVDRGTVTLGRDFYAPATTTTTVPSSTTTSTTFPEPTCRQRRAKCETNDQCCSGQCSRRGRCRRG